MDQDTLKNILTAYNSISPSRRRWINERQQLKNGWKELFQALEQASGRDGVKVVMYDPAWHEVAEKGNTTGPINKACPDMFAQSDEDFTKDGQPNFRTIDDMKTDTTEEAVTEDEAQANAGENDHLAVEDKKTVTDTIERSDETIQTLPVTPVAEEVKENKPATKKKKKSHKKK